MEKSIIKQIEVYEDSYNYVGLDVIAEQHFKKAINDEEFEALLEAYIYVYGQLAVDFASEKYWGDCLSHLNSMIDCLTWLRKLKEDSYYDLEYARNLINKAELISEVDEKKELFELAEDAINELLEKEPENLKYKLEKLELLIDSYEQKVNESKSIEGTLDLLKEMSQTIDSSNYSAVCSAMIYSRRLKNYNEFSKLVKINEEFDNHSQTIWSSHPNTLISWCSQYIYKFYHHISIYHFNKWFSVAKKIPERLNGNEKNLSKLSYDIYCISSLLEEKGFILEAEKTYLLSLEIEQLIYSSSEGKKMAWRKLSFAKSLVYFYVSHNRINEAVKLLKEHLNYGTKLINEGFEDSELHSQMRHLRILIIELSDSERTKENYQKVILHCKRKIALLKEKFNEYDKVGDKKLWRYLFYLYKEDYIEQIRYNLLLNKREEAVKVLKTWFEYTIEFNEVYPNSSYILNNIKALKQDKDFELVYNEIDALLSKL